MKSPLALTAAELDSLVARGLVTRAKPAEGLADPRARPGEIPYKQWLYEKTIELGISLPCLRTRLSRGQVIRPKLRWVNKRIAFVLPEGQP